ncbi:MAG: hypothetical protein K0S45_3872 [Nitrospira sp.]|jgi:hypothetical protein|nr:hypothetical protein [Nitrospira sp.]
MGQRDPPMASMGGTVIFPGQESIEHSGFGIGKAAIQESLEAFSSFRKDFISFSRISLDAQPTRLHLMARYIKRQSLFK